MGFASSLLLIPCADLGEHCRSRSLNWSISLLALLFLIVFLIPLGLCLLLTHRTRQTPAPRTMLLTLVPFTIYLVLYYRFGAYIASKVVVEGAHSIGLINALLSRTCVPGVMLIASLSGGGAVNTAWEAYEWRSISSASVFPVLRNCFAIADVETPIPENRSPTRKFSRPSDRCIERGWTFRNGVARSPSLPRQPLAKQKRQRRNRFCQDGLPRLRRLRIWRISNWSSRVWKRWRDRW